MFWNTCKAGSGGAAVASKADAKTDNPEPLSRSSSRGYPDFGVESRSMPEPATDTAQAASKPGIAVARTRPRRAPREAGAPVEGPGRPAAQRTTSPGSGSPASPKRCEAHSRRSRARGPPLAGSEGSSGEDGIQDDETLAERVWTFGNG